MTTTQHTAGPWQGQAPDGKFPDSDWLARNDDARHTSHAPILAANGETVALVVRTDWNDAQLEADARLIAAAPELFELLSKRVENAEQRAFEDWLARTSPSGEVEQVQDQWERSSDFSDFCDEWEAERAALAKATGSAA